MEERVAPAVSSKQISVGFASLGVLVGSIAGLSSAELTLPLFGFLFAFAGGSLIAFMDKIPRQTLQLAGGALAAFSIGAGIFLYVGLLIKVNEVLYLDIRQRNALEVRASSQKTSNATAATQPYRSLLRSHEGQALQEYLKDEIVSGNMELSAACSRLNEPVTQKPTKAN